MALSLQRRIEQVRSGTEAEGYTLYDSVRIQAHVLSSRVKMDIVICIADDFCVN